MCHKNISNNWIIESYMSLGWILTTFREFLFSSRRILCSESSRALSSVLHQTLIGGTDCNSHTGWLACQTMSQIVNKQSRKFQERKTRKAFAVRCCTSFTSLKWVRFVIVMQTDPTMHSSHCFIAMQQNEKKKVLHRQLSIGYGQPLCNCLMVSSSWVMNGKEPAWAAAIHREPQWRENKQTCWFTLRKWILLLFFCTCVVVLTREVTVQLRLDPLGVQVDNWFQLMLTRLRIVYKTASERSWAAGLGFADANKSKLTRIKASI